MKAEDRLQYLKERRKENYTQYELREFETPIEWKYQFSSLNYEIKDIMVSTKPCYTRKELKEKFQYFDKTFHDINDFLEKQELNTDDKDLTPGVYSNVHDRDLFVELYFRSQSLYDINFFEFISKYKTTKDVHIMDSREQ